MKNSTNHFSRVLGALLLCAGAMFASCDKGSLDDEGLAGQNGSGVYLGVIGFNQQLYTYDISKLNDVTTRACEGFIDQLAMKNGTILYYSVDQAINMMQKEARKFTNPLSTAAIVTFTDGLDQGSIMMGGSSCDNNTDYLNYLNKRIKNETVAGSRITAYSIGVPGRDVADVESFRNNLTKLASSDEKAIEVSNMDEVNSEFMEIASQLSSSAILQTVNLTIPGVSDGTKIRFTFDKASSANSSSVYIEGTYKFSNSSLSNVKYVGVSSTSGSVVYGKRETCSIFVKFSFEGFQTDSGMTISSQNIDEWLYVPASEIWQINSEFDKNENTEIVTEQSSALIMLVLDCSSSLAADFVKAQKNAKDFVKTLHGASSGELSNIILTPSSGKHNWSSGTYSFRYAISGKNASSQSVSATENESWISNVKNDGSSISYTLSENNSGSSRSGKITVRCADMSRDYVVKQDPELSANCYIVSSPGVYKFRTVKGNSSISVGTVASAAVLWESFGTSTTPNVGDLIKSVSYKDGYITFQTADTFKEGNVVIAAKNSSGTILWSWHIWLTDQPQGQEYYNNAGTMMDRNLGATSAAPGDVGALGLIYHWGRKDPFLGSSSITSISTAASTISWPSYVSSNSSYGTIAYATANPTTFIKYNSSNYDWYYTGSSSTDNTRWTTSEKTKSIYDPCPAGWRVPDGGSNGVWSKALGSSYTRPSYDSANEGMNISGKFGSASTIWYPASGYRYYGGGSLYNVGYSGLYWSASPYYYYAYYLLFSSSGYVLPSSNHPRAYGQSVRCLQE